MIQRLIDRMTPATHMGSYAIAAATVVAVIVMRLVLHPFVGDEVPFLLLFSAVLVSAGLGGLGPGLFTTFIGATATILFVINPEHTLWIDDRRDLLPTLRFLVEGVLISVLGSGLNSARRRALQSEAEARQLEQRILDISDDERRRFGQDLHDGLGQHLTGVAFLTKALQQRLIGRSLPEAEDATKIAMLVNESIGQTRALARGLAPVGLEGAGLIAALSQLASATSSIFSLECTFSYDSALDSPSLGISTHLYRIAQEAITNAIRHGKARRIEIDLDRQGQSLRLSIEDDGLGIAAARDNGGMGLQIMSFRARMLGGSLAVVRREGGGTTVACIVPFRTAVQAAS